MSTVRRSVVGRTRPRVASCLLLLLVAGCHESGTWVDDSANWQRAFGQSAPDGVRVERSWYWRSSHFMREEAFHFAFTAPPEVEESLRQANRMQPFAGDIGEVLRSRCCFDVPDWFPQADSGGFEAWVWGQGALFRRDADGRLFLCGCQI